jgi:hypothetical protein
VTTHQVKYEGPSSFAVRVATLLADADGIELKSAEKQEYGDGPAGVVLLALSVEGTSEAVMAAVRSIAAGLPTEARITLEDSVEGS